MDHRSWNLVMERIFAHTVASRVRLDDVCEGIWHNAMFMFLSPEPRPADMQQHTVLAVKC